MKLKRNNNIIIKITFLLLLIIIFIFHINYPLLFYNIFGLLHNNNSKQNESLDIVIAHYKEDLSWVDTVIPKHARIFIYSKSDEVPNCKASYIHTKLDNVGRCDHTYLYHIISNYDKTLCENTLFLPGSCDLWYKKVQVNILVGNISKLKFNNVLLINNNFFMKRVINISHNQMIKIGYCSTHEANKHSNCDLIQHKFENINEFKKYFHIKTPRYSVQGIYMIKTNQIFNRSKEYYTDLINTVNNGDNLLNGHFLEKCWYGIFII